MIAIAFTSWQAGWLSTLPRTFVLVGCGPFLPFLSVSPIWSLSPAETKEGKIGGRGKKRWYQKICLSLPLPAAAAASVVDRETERVKEREMNDVKMGIWEISVLSKSGAIRTIFSSFRHFFLSLSPLFLPWEIGFYSRENKRIFPECNESTVYLIHACIRTCKSNLSTMCTAAGLGCCCCRKSHAIH